MKNYFLLFFLVLFTMPSEAKTEQEVIELSLKACDKVVIWINDDHKDEIEDEDIEASVIIVKGNTAFFANSYLCGGKSQLTSALVLETLWDAPADAQIANCLLTKGTSNKNLLSRIEDIYKGTRLGDKTVIHKKASKPTCEPPQRATEKNLIQRLSAANKVQAIKQLTIDELAVRCTKDKDIDVCGFLAGVNRGWSRFKGQWLPLDLAKSLHFYRTGCYAGSKESDTQCAFLINLLIDMYLPTKANKMVFDVLRLRCEQYNTSAGCYGLASAYLSGEGIEQDVAKGMKMTESLCNVKRYGRACSQLSFVYKYGKYGIGKDARRAEHFDALSSKYSS